MTTEIQKSWDGLKHNLPLIAGLTLIYFIGVAIMTLLPFVGGFLTGPFTLGYMLCLLKIEKREEISYQDIFWGFLELNRLGHILLCNGLVTILMVIGFIFLIIPGIYIVVATAFASALLLLHETDAVSAIKKSFEIVKGRWWSIAGFLILLALTNLVGTLALGIGILISMPVTTLALVKTAAKLSNSTKFTSEPGLQSGELPSL